MTKEDMEVVDYYRQRTLHTDWEIHQETLIDYDEIVKHKTTEPVHPRFNENFGKWFWEKVLNND